MSNAEILVIQNPSHTGDIKSTEEIYLKNFARLFPPDNPHPSKSLEAMTWFEHQTNLPPALKPLYEKILSLFDTHNAGCATTESYHQGFHSIAFAIGAHESVEKAKIGIDPLEIVKDLKSYNQQNRTNLSIDNLRIALLILAITHDTGDIIRQIDTTTPPYPIHFHQMHGVNLYISNDTEKLSSQFAPILAEEYIDKTKLSEDELLNLPDILNLVAYLTPHTSFMATDDEAKQPFGLATRFLDQISQASYNILGINAVLGLTREQFLERLIATPEFKLLFESDTNQNLENQNGQIPEEVCWFLLVLNQLYPENNFVDNLNIPYSYKDYGADLLEALLSNIDKDAFKITPIFYVNFVNIRGRQLAKQFLQSRHGSLLPEIVIEQKLNEITSLWNKPVDCGASQALTRSYNPWDKIHLNELASDIAKFQRYFA